MATSKTPGGISKSFLTPCRRLGLSRKWKSGSSPFISPLSQNVDNENKTPENLLNKKKPTKRLHDAENTEVKKLVERGDFESDTVNNDSIVSTPIRGSSFSRRKKSKSSLESITHENEREKYNSSQTPTEDELVDDKVNIDCNTESKLHYFQELKSKVPSSGNSLTRSHSPESTLIKSGNLSKDCIVVIEKQFLGTDNVCSTLNKVQSDVKHDDEDIPLSRIKKINKSNSKIESDDCNDFCEKNPNVILKVTKLEDKKTSTSDLNENKRKNRKEKAKPLITTVVDDQLSSQKSNLVHDDDDDDDFDLMSKKTILIKKTYNKTKLSRAKSTGSITQKDIDELKARIEAKQRLLIAKTNSSEFEELRALIKKWQKGCQEALAELLDLMKKKIPENQLMNYSELLKTLNIPPSLAGYDEENDCFFSPCERGGEGGEKPIMGRLCARAHRCVRLSQTKNLLNNLSLQWREQNAITPS
ncbi:hypothetical protein EVAR_90139_1 [Eumeta japonica]|uniref:Swi5-dependent recombination DNA repair protein 1 homolog n=1 Tax=Eumeta variegata TaxID=151549 RepID=A0A4C1ZZT9_EUMVA|nr:hypothetical protein EVAR_90139_1 [Eumeta japonica]